MAGVSTPASFSLTNNPAAAASITVISAGGQTATVNGDFAKPLVIKVTDQYGNAITGATVTFNAPANGAGGSSSNSTSMITGTTDATGQISETFTANTVAGAYSVTASAAGVSTPASFSLTNKAGAAANVAAISGSGQAPRPTALSPSR